MKKNILYSLAFVAVIFASCNPLKDAINDIKPDPNNVKTLAITAAKTYESTEAANVGIAAQLNKDYPQMANGTKANVTYSFKTNTVKPVDSVFANIQYAVTDADYLATNGNANKNFTATKVLDFLESKYPMATTPVNKLVILSYAFFQSGVTTNAGLPVVEAFLLQNIGWQKIYLVSPAQYASIGRSVNNAFATADQANIATYLNAFLKADPNVMLTAKVGDVRYISYKYFVSASAIHQKVYALSFDATGNWVPSATLAFLKQDGKWIPDPTIYHTMVAADYLALNVIGTEYTFGTATNRKNAADFKSFNINATDGRQWAQAEIKKALAYVLTLKFPDAAPNPKLPYSITYSEYSGKYVNVPVIFYKTATGFVLAESL